MNLQIVQIVLDKYGLREVPGTKDNPEILQMAKDAGFTDYTHDEIAWCSMLLNWACWKAGLQRTNSLAARSWLSVGSIVSVPEIGDVVVFWREDPNGPFGHVGLYIGFRNGLIYVLGGNQGNMIQIEGFDPDRLLGYRRLAPIAPKNAL